MTIEPDPLFKLMRADEVAETWEGIPRELYAKLWNDIVSIQKNIPNIEDSGPHDHIGFENLASHWTLLDPSDQELLNKLAQKRHEEHDAWYKQFRSQI